MGLPRTSNDDALVSQPMFSDLSSDPPPTNPVDLFRVPKNHANAVGCIWTFFSEKTGFIPAMGLKGQADKFPDYIEQISTFLGFYLEFNRQSGRKQTSNNINLIINDIKSMYDGVLDVNIKGIVDSLNNMAKTIANSSHDKIDDSPNHSNMLYVSIFYCTLSMTVDNSGKKTYHEQEYYVNRSVFVVNSSFLTAYALDLSTLLGLGDWGQAKQKMSSPIEGTKLTCIDKTLGITTEENALASAPREN
ncbi:hypothetical protein BGZ80_002840 [Entomortierella chlamydospora]|uniref:Uncharacterized protein n=1 Tax=Entomortierella chlamydospora TaxID=101097 RepID=A0A9P6SX04_9FUNG|nr:hypothetical protein BGZ79_003302 [Entomortierella chlamydospora]KAG0009002.1 hypothetical protein BGZ80_002840 [Entomortierella chlamydospora]